MALVLTITLGGALTLGVTQEQADNFVNVADVTFTAPDSRQADYSEWEARLQAWEERLNAMEAALNDSAKNLQDSMDQLNAARAQLEADKAQLAQSMNSYNVDMAAYEAAKEQLFNDQANLDASKEKLSEDSASYDAAQKELDNARAQLEATYANLEEGRKVINAAIAQYNADRASLESQWVVLQNAQGKLVDDRKAHDEGVNEWKSGVDAMNAQRAELDNRSLEYEMSLNAYHLSYTQWNVDQKSLEDAIAQFAIEWAQKNSDFDNEVQQWNITIETHTVTWNQKDSQAAALEAEGMEAHKTHEYLMMELNKIREENNSLAAEIAEKEANAPKDEVEQLMEISDNEEDLDQNIDIGQGAPDLEWG